MGRRGDASCPRRRPRTTFLNYDKDIIRVITGVQGASLRKPKTTQIVVFLFIQKSTGTGYQPFLSLELKLLALVVQRLVVGQCVFRLEQLPAERTIVLDEIVVDVSHVNFQYTPVLEPLSTILAIKV